ncbi:chorismate mutase [Pseudoxanthobacter soli]|uniref:chorismate mutase n=1 Tax=Pseudoxanthobacter soli TaxID=433840 RepID=UPI001AEC79E3|nr:chorismate mutase [Pseudoxanthobacter soli]
MACLLLLALAAVSAATMPAPVSAADQMPVPHGTPQAAGGTCCDSLAEVRQNIDRIDSAILKLMAERGTYVREAGRFKANAASVQDDARVARIIAKVRAEAEADGLSPDVAEATYRAMIAAFTEEEKKQVETRGK